MKPSRAFRQVFPSLLLLAAASACVTVNVTFPESNVQKATDDFVRELYKTRDSKKGTPATSSTQPQSKAAPAAPAAARPHALLELLMSEAVAADIQIQAFNLESPGIVSVREKLAPRVGELLAHKSSGAVGEDQRGMLTLRDGSKLNPLLKKKVEQLIEAENSDREDLYKEVARANRGSNVTSEVAAHAFSKSFQSASPSGTWIEDRPGHWAQKP